MQRKISQLHYFLLWRKDFGIFFKKTKWKPILDWKNKKFPLPLKTPNTQILILLSLCLTSLQVKHLLAKPINEGCSQSIKLRWSEKLSFETLQTSCSEPIFPQLNLCLVCSHFPQVVMALAIWNNLLIFRHVVLFPLLKFNCAGLTFWFSTVKKADWIYWNFCGWFKSTDSISQYIH